MKKYAFLLMSVMFMAFMSCSSDEEVDIQYQVNVTVDPSTAIAPFHGYSVNNTVSGVGMYDGAKLLVTSLIYNEAGTLVEKREITVDNYSQKANFSLSMNEGEEWTIVTITNSVLLGSETGKAYEISGTDRLESLSITSQRRNGFSGGSNFMLLGLASQKVNAKTKENIIYVKPASAMVAVVFSDIHALDEAGVDSHYVVYDNNTIVNYQNNDFSFGTDNSVNSGYFLAVDVTQYSGYRVVALLYLLPTPNMYINGGLSIGNVDFSYPELLEAMGENVEDGYSIISIEAGKEYLIEVDCGEGTVSASAYTRSEFSNQMLPDCELNKDSVHSGEYGLTKQMPVKVLDLINEINE